MIVTTYLKYGQNANKRKELRSGVINEWAGKNILNIWQQNKTKE